MALNIDVCTTWADEVKTLGLNRLHDSEILQQWLLTSHCIGHAFLVHDTS